MPICVKCQAHFWTKDGHTCGVVPATNSRGTRATTHPLGAGSKSSLSQAQGAAVSSKGTTTTGDKNRPSRGSGPSGQEDRLQPETVAGNHVGETGTPTGAMSVDRAAASRAAIMQILNAAGLGSDAAARGSAPTATATTRRRPPPRRHVHKVIVMLAPPPFVPTALPSPASTATSTHPKSAT